MKFERAPTLVRGLDYYRHTAFEFVTDRLGAQGTVLGGGRYDGLIETLGGPHTPAVGWAAGIERLAMLVGDADRSPSDDLDVMIALENDDAFLFAMKKLAELRRHGFKADMIATGSPRKRFDKAAKAGATHLVSINFAEGSVQVNVRGENLDERQTRSIHVILAPGP